jgi:hypothetical protein
MSPIISRSGFSLGFGRRRGGAGPAVTQINDSYLFAPFNENSTSHTLFGGYASSLTTASGGTYNASIHPYTITDSTYNSGNNTSYRCQDACNVFYVSNANSILGSLGTSNFCLDFWFDWRAYGNGGGSYGQIGDLNAGSCGARNGTNNGGAGQYFAITAAGDTTVSQEWGLANGTVNLTASNLNQWYHYMLIRQSGVFYTFLDGVLKIVNTSDTGDSISNGGGWAFGSYYRNDSPHYWNVNFSDFMFTRDSDCQYSLNNTTSGDVNTTFFSRPEYKNKLMPSSSLSKFFISNKPSGFN